MSIERGGPSPEEMGITPESVETMSPLEQAQNETASYWTERLSANQERSTNPTGTQGLDFDIARSEAYLENIKAGKFFDGVKVEGTYDGSERTADEKSVYDFFKGTLEAAETLKDKEGWGKDNPELKQKYEVEAERMKKIVEAIEKTKPTDTK